MTSCSPFDTCSVGATAPSSSADRAAIDEVLGAITALPRPFEIDLAAIDEQSYALVFRLPSRERHMLPLIAKSLGARPQETAFDGGAVGRCMTAFGMFYEAVIDDTDHCVLFEGRAARSEAGVTWMTRHFGGEAVFEPEERRRWDGLRGGGVRCYFATKRLAPEVAEVLESPFVRELIGDGSLDLGVCWHMDQGRLVLDCQADIDAEGGMLGALAKGAAMPRVVTWLPPDAQEFFAASVDVDAADALLELPLVKAAFGGDPGARALHGFLTGSWNGQLAGFGRRSTVAEALGADSEEQFVLLLGAAEAPKALDQALRGFATRPLDDLNDGGTAVALIDDQDAPLLVLAARDDVIWLCGADEGSRELLRASLRTDGRASLPRTFLGRLTGPMPAAPIGVALSSQLSDIAGVVALRQVAGRETSGFERGIIEAFEGAPGIFAAWVTLDGSGLRWRMTY